MIEDKNRGGPQGSESDVPRVGLDHAIHKAVHQSLEPTLSFFLKPIEITVSGVVRLFSKPHARMRVVETSIQAKRHPEAIAVTRKTKRMRAKRVRAAAPEAQVPAAPKDDLIYFKKTTRTHVSAKTSHASEQVLKNEDSHATESTSSIKSFQIGATY